VTSAYIDPEVGGETARQGMARNGHDTPVARLKENLGFLANHLRRHRAGRRSFFRHRFPSASMHAFRAQDGRRQRAGIRFRLLPGTPPKHLLTNRVRSTLTVAIPPVLRTTTSRTASIASNRRDVETPARRCPSIAEEGRPHMANISGGIRSLDVSAAR